MRSLVLMTALAASLCMAPVVSTQSRGDWKPLFNGKDLTGWRVLAGGRRGAPPPANPSNNPEDRGWKVEDGTITSVPHADGQRSGSLATVDKFDDFEIEFDFKLAESGTKCTPALGENQVNLSEDKTCTFNSGMSFRTGYQLNLGRREAGE